VSADKVVRTIDPRFFGCNMLFMWDDGAALADGRIAKCLREMPCRLLRFPGGDVADNYLWKTHTLDDPKWWPAVQGPHTTDTDEFMAFCRQAAAEPIFVVNLETGLVRGDLDRAVRDAADWVKYCNKEKGYKVRYWEIGNETYLYVRTEAHKHKRVDVTPEEYGRAFVKFARAMKAVDSTILVGAIGPSYLGKYKAGNWWQGVAPIVADDFDIAVVHQYYNPPSYEKYASRPLGLGRDVAELREFLRRAAPKWKPLVALTEWNVGKEGKDGGMAYALMLADQVGAYVTGGVDLANFWPLRCRSSFRALLDWKTRQPETAWQVLSLLSRNFAGRLIQAAASHKQVFTYAALAEDGRSLTVFVGNKTTGEGGLDVRIDAAGFPARSAKAVCLNGSTLTSEDVAPRDAEVRLEDGHAAFHAAPHSFTMITLTK